MSGRITAPRVQTQASFVPVPSIYLDEVMPWLTDTEWRVLLVVLRQTVGWNKERDWITRSQMAYKTGKSVDAVSRAVEGLVRSDLVIVENEGGSAMASTAERRRLSRDRLYYRLSRVTKAVVADLIQQRT